MSESEPPRIGDRTFWRDVMVQAVSGIVAGVVLFCLAFMWAVFTGYLSVPDATERWTVVLIAVPLLAMAGILALITVASVKTMAKQYTRGQLVGYTVVLVVCMTGIIAPVIVFWAIAFSRTL